MKVHVHFSFFIFGASHLIGQNKRELSVPLQTSLFCMLVTSNIISKALLTIKITNYRYKDLFVKLFFRIFQRNVCLGESRLQTPGRRPTHFAPFRNLDMCIFCYYRHVIPSHLIFIIIIVKAYSVINVLLQYYFLFNKTN